MPLTCPPSVMIYFEKLSSTTITTFVSSGTLTAALSVRSCVKVRGVKRREASSSGMKR